MFSNILGMAVDDYGQGERGGDQAGAGSCLRLPATVRKFIIVPVVSINIVHNQDIEIRDSTLGFTRFTFFISK